MDEDVRKMIPEMTPRERFKKIMNFERPDQYIWMEDQVDTTTLRWVREGLPIDQVMQTSYDLSYNGGLWIVFPTSYTFDVSKYFGFLNVGVVSKTTITLDLGPLPRYPLRTIKENEDRVLCRDPLGGKIEYSKTDYAMPHFHEFPVKNLKDWNHYKKRLDPKDPRRYPKDYSSEEYSEIFEESTIPTLMVINGFYGFGRGVMGTEAFVPAFYTNPELVHDMMNTFADFLIDATREVVEALKSRIDYVLWWEDLAFGKGPNISPKVFKEFMLPNMKKVTSFLNKNGIDLIIMDSDGDFRPLMPLLWDGGIRGTWPLEVNAGMDAVELRKKLGKTWRFIGNIDKQTLTKGEEAIKHEVDRKVPYLLEEGGYIPGLDHTIPPDIPLKNFRFYASYIKKVLNI
jgi:uroporphyrinogen decarboxylase